MITLTVVVDMEPSDRLVVKLPVMDSRPVTDGLKRTPFVSA